MPSPEVVTCPSCGAERWDGVGPCENLISDTDDTTCGAFLPGISDLFEPPDTPLVRATRNDLAAAGVEDSTYGRLAIELARRLGQPNLTSVGPVSREFRMVLAAALEGATVSISAGGEDAEDDPVARAKAARDSKRQDALAGEARTDPPNVDDSADVRDDVRPRGRGRSPSHGHGARP